MPIGTSIWQGKREEGRQAKRRVREDREGKEGGTPRRGGGHDGEDTPSDIRATKIFIAHLIE